MSSDRATPKAKAAFSPGQWIAAGMLLLSVGVLLVAVMLPSYTLSWLRSDYRWLGRPLNWMEGLPVPLDTVHVLLFAWVTLCVRWLFPRLRWWQVALCMLAVAVATELLQFFAPGREPKMLDVLDDLVGVGLGLGLAAALFWLARFRTTDAVDHGRHGDCDRLDDQV